MDTSRSLTKSEIYGCIFIFACIIYTIGNVGADVLGWLMQ